MRLQLMLPKFRTAQDVQEYIVESLVKGFSKECPKR